MDRQVRTHKIIEELKRHQPLNAEQLSKLLDSSIATTYRDINELARRNLVRKTHGGVHLPSKKTVLDESVETRFTTRLAKNRISKEQIAAKASRLVLDNDIIFVDSSTTVYYLVRNLVENQRQYSNLTIVTNSAAVIRELTDLPPSFTLISIGGVYDTSLNSFLGRMALESVSHLHFSRAFVSAAAVTTENTYTSYENHAEFLKHVVGHSDKAHLLVDSTKFEARAIFPICPSSSFASIISDPSLTPNLVSKYLEAGLNLDL